MDARADRGGPLPVPRGCAARPAHARRASRATGLGLAVTRRTVGALLSWCLRDAGVTRTFGAALPELEHVAIAEPSLAALLADDDGRVGPAPGVTVLPDQVVRISSRPGDPGAEVVVDDPNELAPAVLRATTAARYRLHALRLRLELELDAPAPPDAQPAVLPRSEEHTSELQSRRDLVCRLLLEKKKKK